MPERSGARQSPWLFSEFRLRGARIPNRVVFAPLHSRWTRDRVGPAPRSQPDRAYQDPAFPAMQGLP